MKIKVSIIVPAFNAQNYIRTSVESLQNQTLSEIEIIIVNDGSTDSTKDIIEEIANTDDRIKIINQKNSSVGSSRNNGVIKASGKYITFMDSDDSMQINMLEVLYNKAETEQCDIVACGHHEVDDKNNIIKSVLQKSNTIKYIDFISKKIDHTSWGKLYKKDLFTQNNIKFLPNVWCEDLASTHELFYFSKKSICINRCLYNYYVNPNGATYNVTQKYIDDVFKALDHFKSFLVTNKIYDIYEREFNNSVFQNIGFMSTIISNYKNPDIKKYFLLKIKNTNFSCIEKDVFQNPHFYNLKYIYFKFVINQIFNANIKSVFIYGYGEPFKEIEAYLNYLDIKINGIIETHNRCINTKYNYGTLEHYKSKLNNSTIFIISLSYFHEIKTNIQKFSKLHNIKIKVY